MPYIKDPITGKYTKIPDTQNIGVKPISAPVNVTPPPPPTPAPLPPVAIKSEQRPSINKEQNQFLAERYKTTLKEAKGLLKQNRIQEAQDKLNEAKKIKNGFGLKFLAWQIKRHISTQQKSEKTAEQIAEKIKKQELAKKEQATKEAAKKQAEQLRQDEQIAAQQLARQQAIAQQKLHQAELEKQRLSTIVQPPSAPPPPDLPIQTDQTKTILESQLIQQEKQRLEQLEQEKRQQLELAKAERQKLEAEKQRIAQEKLNLEKARADFEKQKAVPPPDVQPPSLAVSAFQSIYGPSIASNKSLPSPAPKPYSLPAAQPSFFLKRAVISGVATFIIAILAVSSWFYFKKSPTQPNPTPTITQTLPPPAKAPIPLIKNDEDLNIEIKATDTPLKNQLQSILDKKYSYNKLRAFTIKKEGQYLVSPQQIAQSTGISLPNNILTSLGNQATLYLYTQKDASESPFISGFGPNRLALAIQAQASQILTDGLKQWEKTIITDLNSLLPAQKPFTAQKEFAKENYQGVEISYINLPDRTLTINYATLNNLLLIGTSREAILKLIDTAKLQ